MPPLRWHTLTEILEFHMIGDVSDRFMYLLGKKETHQNEFDAVRKLLDAKSMEVAKFLSRASHVSEDTTVETKLLQHLKWIQRALVPMVGSHRTYFVGTPWTVDPHPRLDFLYY